jgi:hypothetical protein
MARKAKPQGEEPLDEVDEEGPVAPEPIVPLVEVPGYGEYEIDIEAVMRQRLPEFFDGLQATRLTDENIMAIPSGMKGAYLLFRQDTDVPVYAGKTDAEHGFHYRLTRHAKSVKGRHNLDPSQMFFKAARIMVFSALDVEAILIKRMKDLIPGSLTWNNSGFGSNDPGRRRDGQEPSRFDQDFPIDFDFRLSGLPGGDVTLKPLLKSIKQELPFLFRYAKGVPGNVVVPDTPTAGSLREVMKLVMSALPIGWQTTVLHHRVVLYPKKADYEFQQEVLRS